MTLLDELRNVEPGKPGQWSRRLSVTLACMLLVLVTAVGLQVRVRAKLLPRLASADESFPALEEKLQEARRAERRTYLLRMDLEKMGEQLRQTGARIPRGAESLDLAVSLATGLPGSPIEEVWPWQPTGELSRRFPHLGVEVQMAGEYGEIVGAIGHVMGAAELRELAEFDIESGDGSENDRLRAGARLLAYFANDRHADGLLDIGAVGSAMAQTPSTRLDLRSPFAASPWEIDSGGTEARGEKRGLPRRGGFIRVGNRRYRIVDDAEGRPRLHPETP